MFLLDVRIDLKRYIFKKKKHLTLSGRKYGDSWRERERCGRNEVIMYSNLFIYFSSTETLKADGELFI